ncbi:hypothetical protein AN641_02355 [Candidatus Epulonipiscioides gigas]|nr:hypothetical protein AN641_02355 [Epulopiscium sp. SCG-C07WGA-EpuloA2]
MATIKTFKAIRPNPEFVIKVASLPYDVMSTKEAKEMVKDNPYSFLHVDRSEIDFVEDVDPHSKKVYEKATQNFNKMLEDKILIQDEQEYFYIYKLNNQIGLACVTKIDEYLDNTIKKHEFTRPDKEDDRVNHFDYCNANTSPIFSTYHQNNDVDKIINKYIDENAPVYDFVSEDEVSHTVWVIKDNYVAQNLVDIFKTIPNLYIADGHHRNASASRVALKRREQNPNFTGAENFNYYLSVLFPDTQLNILDYNRVVTDLNGNTKDEFLMKIGKDFNVIEYNVIDCYSPKKHSEFGMYLEKKWYILEAKLNTIPNDPKDRLDVSVLQNNLLKPILGIDDPRTSERISFIGGIRGLDELVKLVDSGEFKVAFSMYPTEMSELLAIADAGEVMPPKSTWFEPKLRSGLFVYSLKE